MKEAYYFSHDSNSRNDGKILNLRIKHGMRGYGIFWAIIEMLRDERNYKMLMQCERIAFELHEDSEVIRSVLQDFDLFVIEDGFFWSESLLRRMQMKDQKSNKARESALKRWNKPVKSERNANALQTQSDSNASKGKESKEKEITNRAFVADANKDERQYRKYLYDLIAEKKISRDVLFQKWSIDVEKRNQIWEEFIKNAILNTPLIEDEKHGWNVFKKFIQDNSDQFTTKKPIKFNRTPQ